MGACIGPSHCWHGRIRSASSGRDSTDRYAQVYFISIFLTFATDLVSLASLPLWRSALVIVQSCGFMLGSPLGSSLAAVTSWHMYGYPFNAWNTAYT